jgi:hypothetical protein
MIFTTLPVSSSIKKQPKQYMIFLTNFLDLKDTGLLRDRKDFWGEWYFFIQMEMSYFLQAQYFSKAHNEALNHST